MAKQQKVYERKNIIARIYDIREGLREIQHVDFIRIKSTHYNLMILEDYMPLLGELEGNLTIQAQGETLSLEDVHGFYIHQNNLFRLMLKEKRED